MADLSSLLMKTWPVRLAKDALSTAYSAATLPGDVWAGRVSPNDPEFYERATDLAGFTTLGTLAGPRGVLGSGATRPRRPPPPPRLPMDVESRMQRARDMGFFTDDKLYHGTAAREFEAFDLGRAGSVTRAPPARQGIWTSDDPEVANAFAQLAANKTGGNPRVMPLLARTDKPLILELEGNPTLKQLGKRVAEAWEAGHDAVLVRNHFHRPGHPRGDSLVVRNPNQLRSTQAAFDPARRNDSELLAGIGAAAAAGLPQWFNEGDDEEGL